MKRIYSIILFLFAFCLLNANTKTSLDSLLNIVSTTSDLKQKFATYRNLADIHFEEPAEITYLKAAYKTALQLDNKKESLNTLLDLSYSYAKVKQLDSANYYMNIIKKEANPKDVDSYLAYLRMKIFDKRITKGKEESEAAVQEEMNIFKYADKNNIYIRIEQAYVTGSCLYEDNKYKESIPYLENAYNLAKSLSGKEQYRYAIITGWIYAAPFRFIGNKAKSLELIEEVLRQHKERYNKFFAKQRPFYPVHLHYLQCYATLIMHIDILPQEKTLYYIREINKIAPNITAPLDKYSYFLALNNFSAYTHDYKHALSYNDSLLKYAPIVAPNIIPQLLNTQSKIYALMNDYKRALESHRLYASVKDSLQSKETQKQLNELQVQYKIDKLTYEKIRMANNNKRTILIILTFVLLFTCVICIYLYSHLKKEQRMKKRLCELNEKAEESEKLKTAFLNSMCHEIRTPLNAIVGFSGIITDESLDSASKQEFHEQIATNSDKLTSLIDHLLIVANLDSSEEKLPCELTNIKDICRQEMEKARQRGKSSIIYTQEYSQDEINIQTNSGYLALVLENLLDNANKFTEQGEIKLEVNLDNNQNLIQIYVTDTGSGIPLEKQEYVFQRFTKLDSFIQGNGLGLYLCQLVIKRLSGNIRIDSTYIEGSRFVIHLPT